MIYIITLSEPLYPHIKILLYVSFTLISLIQLKIIIFITFFHENLDIEIQLKFEGFYSAHIALQSVLRTF